MRKIIMILGLGLFLFAFSTHIQTSIKGGMQMTTSKALAQGTDNCTYYWYVSHEVLITCSHCMPPSGGGAVFAQGCAVDGTGCRECPCPC